MPAAGLTDVEQRYRKRYLDLLMNEETRTDFQLRRAGLTNPVMAGIITS